MSSRSSRPAAGDLGLIVLRIAVGGIAFAHGMQKLLTMGVDGTAGMLAGMGVPLPQAAAVLILAIEIIGGVLLVLGLGQRVVGLLIAADMVGAIVLAHAPYGIFVADGGWELAALLGAGALALALTGSGSLGLDRVLSRR